MPLRGVLPGGHKEIMKFQNVLFNEIYEDSIVTNNFNPG